MTSDTTLIILCCLVIFSYLFDIIASKIKIPSVLLLLFLGIGLKQFTNYIGFFTYDFNHILPALGTLGLILIVFEGALELKYSPQKNRVITRSFFSALVILLATSVTITYIIQYITGKDFYRCFMNAIPFCVISSSIVIPAASVIHDEKKEFIIYESSFSDVLTIILFNFVISNHNFDVRAFTGLSIELITILVFSIGSCLFMLYLIGRIKHHVKFFLLISLITLVYVIGQIYHLSSLIVVLALGLFLNNADQIKLPWFRRFFLYKTLQHDLKQLLQLSAESAFLMRTFFFVMFGFTMDIMQLQNSRIFISAGLILLAIYLIRFLYIKFISKTDLMPELLLVPRGLISVLLFYNLPKEMKITGIETGLLFMIILSTSIIMSLGILVSKRKKIDVGEFEGLE